MATLASLLPTYADVAKRLDEDGKVAVIVELLNQTNEILTDAVVIEANSTTGHKTTVRTGLPSATWRKLYQGVSQGKSTTAQVVDTAGMLEAYGEVDKSLADLNGNTAEFRLSEERAFIEAMNEEMAKVFIYGDTGTAPEKFMGLAPRYNSLSAANGQNIVDGGGTGSDNTSIWFVVWGPNTCHMFYPKGSKAGLDVRDLGEQTLYDSNQKPFQGYRTHYKWDTGASVRDWRYVVRIANIDVSDLLANAGSQANLLSLMIKAYHKIPQIGMGRAAIYMNRTVRTMLDIQAVSKTTLALKVDEVNGKPQTSFWGIPLRTCDQILNTEGRVT